MGRADGDNARTKFDADSYIVVRGETAFTETDGKTGFAAS